MQHHEIIIVVECELNETLLSQHMSAIICNHLQSSAIMFMFLFISLLFRNLIVCHLIVLLRQKTDITTPLHPESTQELVNLTITSTVDVAKCDMQLTLIRS